MNVPADMEDQTTSLLHYNDCAADSGERARAMHVPKPEPVLDGQTALFDMETAA